MGQCVFEPLELRRLLAATVASSSSAPALMNDAVLLAAQPSITGSDPANGATNIPRYQPIILHVMLVNAGQGIDPATLTTANVHMTRTSDGQFVNTNLNIDGAGASITIQPTALLSANTQYTVKVFSGLKDLS